MMALHPIFSDILDSHARVTKAVTPKPDYRGWFIDADSNGYGFHGAHKDFDGPEDSRHVHGWTVKQVESEIDDWWEENCTTCDGTGTIWNNCDPTSGQSVDCDECKP